MTETSQTPSMETIRPDTYGGTITAPRLPSQTFSGPLASRIPLAQTDDDLARYIQSVASWTETALALETDASILHLKRIGDSIKRVANEKVMACMVSVIKDFRASRPAEELGREIAEHG